MIINKPKDWRKGQFIFNFLEWLRINKGFAGIQSSRMADPFNIDDKQFDEYYKEYSETLNK